MIRLQLLLSWVFRSRTTGRITIAQPPNLALAIFLGAAVLRVLLRPTGTAGTIVGGVGSVALAVWAGDEVVRGVNPFRRALGAVVLLSEVVGLIRR